MGRTAASVEPATGWIARILTRWPASRRRRMATVVAIVAIVVATLIASSRLLRLLHTELDLIAYAGLITACWVGAGGALVPVPGVRPASWFMIVQQGSALDPVVVAVLAAAAMALGQTSYFVATRNARRRAHSGAGAGTTASPARDGADPAPPASHRSERMDRAHRRVTRQVQTHGIATVFTVCALPTSLTTLTTTAAAAGGMGYGRYAPAAFLGFLVLASVLVVFGQGLMLLVRSLVPLG